MQNVYTCHCIVCGAVSYFRMIQVRRKLSGTIVFLLAKQVHYYCYLGCNQKELFIQGKGESIHVCLNWQSLYLLVTRFLTEQLTWVIKNTSGTHVSSYHSQLTCHTNLTQPTSALKMDNDQQIECQNSLPLGEKKLSGQGPPLFLFDVPLRSRCRFLKSKCAIVRKELEECN